MNLSFLCILFLFASCVSTHKSYRNQYYKSEKVSTSSEKARKKENNTALSASLKHNSSFIKRWLSVPYQYGGSTRSGVDCSGFTQKYYTVVLGKSIPRTALLQYKSGYSISSRSLTKGDLVFFKNTSNKDIVDHVGIYLGSQEFVHASTSKGVVISSLNEDYYHSNFVGFKRY